MEKIKAKIFVVLLLAAISSSWGQVITTSCTSELINSFTPCFNFITGSTNGGTGSPTQGCCQSLSSLISSSTNCACLILTANIPFSIPINRTLAISLPRRCNSMSVPLQCTGSATPVPSSGTPLGLPPSSSALPPFPATPTTPDSSLEPTSSPVEPTTPTADSGDQPPLLQLPNSAVKLPLSKILLAFVLGTMLAY